MKVNNDFCVACLENKIDLISINSEDDVDDNIQVKLSAMIYDITNLEVREEDGWPDKICTTCQNNLKTAFNFKQLFIRSHNLLNEKFENLMIVVEEGGDEEDDNDELNESTVKIIDEDMEQPITKTVPLEEVVEYEVLDDDMIELKSKNTKKFFCRKCDKRFASARTLEKHLVLAHTEDDTTACHICNINFNHRTKYLEHVTKVHKKSLKSIFDCDKCDRSFKHERELRIHERRQHTSGKPYVCSICGQGLSLKEGLQKHMLIHTGEKPFGCDVCGKHFRHKNALVLHKRYHTGERPYSCEQCGQTFIGKSHYSTHMLIHEGVKPFECEFCGKSFNRRTNLNSHRKIHTGERKHICKECGKGFIQNNALKAHLLSAHKIQMNLTTASNNDDPNKDKRRSIVTRLEITEVL